MQRIATWLAALVTLFPLWGLRRALRAQTGAGSAMPHAHMSLTESRPGTAADTA